MKPISPLTVAALIASLASAAVADEKEIPLSEVPAKPFKAIVLAAGGHEIDEVEVEIEDGVTIYEAEWDGDGGEHSVTVDADGRVLERESPIRRESLPKKVAAAVKRLLPKGGKPKFERCLIAVYEAEVEIDGKEYELLLSEDGEVLESKNIERADKD